MTIFGWIALFFRRIFGSGSTSSPETPVTTPVEEPTVEPTVEDTTVETVQGRRLALLVGINDCGQPGAELRGCVNDVENMWKLLTENFGFKPDDVRVLTDERATKYEILKRLDWLVDNAKSGDQLFFHYSGHGSQVRCRNGDELEDGLDEILIPYGHDWDDPLKDDDLYECFKKIPEGAFLSFICDACHSGSMDRGITLPVGNPHPILERYLAPPLDIALRSCGRDFDPHKKKYRYIGQGFVDRNTDVHANQQKHLLLSGCRDDQTSADAHIDGKFQGALTATFVDCVGHKLDGTWSQLHADTLANLSGRYTQVPQLVGPQQVLDKSLFKGV